jgi:hypothetical protein
MRWGQTKSKVYRNHSIFGSDDNYDLGRKKGKKKDHSGLKKRFTFGEINGVFVYCIRGDVYIPSFR